uniref:Uncharacterized protein n=1 Tax=Oryza rufipogon TaxID=4529 RepID=A0A1V1H360_ORYRU|nr:hypothetical protein [Oryza rufipogon]
MSAAHLFSFSSLFSTSGRPDSIQKNQVNADDGRGRRRARAAAERRRAAGEAEAGIEVERGRVDAGGRRAAGRARWASSRSLRARRITRGATTGGCGQPPSSGFAPYSPHKKNSLGHQCSSKVFGC